MCARIDDDENNVPMSMRATPAEQHLRRSLGVPDDAEQVLVFSESSHWDPDWLFTSDEYFERFVRRNLDQAIEELRREPRRVYSIECMFFLRLYWDRSPDRRDDVRELVNEGRLRLTSSGVTTADTLLPSTEAILRDLLVGQEWLRSNGMEQEPRLAYFTDSFGATPALPSILTAAGFDRTAMTRIDGMFFIGCDIELPGRFPKAGSSAERLLTDERSLDFVWRDRNGAEVLSHWNAFTYGQGDMLASIGASRVYLAPYSRPWRSDRHVARRIRRYAKRLSAVSRTPYLLCPIGFDFVEPIPDLVGLLDRYNRNHYPTTGVWAVNAGIDDYLGLIEPYRDALPVLELDPNPYWTGFYTSRPTLKQRCRTLVDDLLVAEKLSFLPDHGEDPDAVSRELADAWWHAAVSNHHDLITGTSPDRVVEQEQIPWLDQAARTVDAVIGRLAPELPAPNGTADSPAPSAEKPDRDRSPSPTDFPDDLISYRDSGGLWRMGMEFAGGIWKQSARASDRPSRVEADDRPDGLEIAGTTELDGETIRRRAWFDADSPLVRCRIEGMAAQGHTVTARIATGISATELVMDTPGGIVSRPPLRRYDPTFWPLHHFAHLRDDSGRGIAIVQPMPGAISYGPDGTVELVAFRNATKEKIFGLIGIPGNPAAGHEREHYAFEYALLPTESGDWRDNGLHLLARAIRFAPWDDLGGRAVRDAADSVVTTDSRDVRVTAVKTASRGDGVIIRLRAGVVPEQPIIVTTHHVAIREAFRCDARERDLEPLAVTGAGVRLTMKGTVETIRLLPS